MLAKCLEKDPPLRTLMSNSRLEHMLDFVCAPHMYHHSHPQELHSLVEYRHAIVEQGLGSGVKQAGFKFWLYHCDPAQVNLLL